MNGSNESVERLKRRRTASEPHVREFLDERKVFRVEELDQFLSTKYPLRPRERNTILADYVRQDRIARVRRGIYVVGNGRIPASEFPVSELLLASRLTEDAVLAYLSAVEWRVGGYTMYYVTRYTSQHRSAKLVHRARTHYRVPVPKALAGQNQSMFGVETIMWYGMPVRVTTPARTLVDSLDRPNISGGWEEIWQSFEMFDTSELDLDEVLAYTALLGNATTAARVGFYLEQNRDLFRVGAKHLNQLELMRPKSPHYMERRRPKGCLWVERWNLMVPGEILSDEWCAVV